MYTVSSISTLEYTCGNESVHVVVIQSQCIDEAIEHRYDVVSNSY